jgi:hypothetical protein
MASSKKEKHYANSRARRQSDGTSHSKKSKKDRDADTESVSSASTDTVIAEAKCPLRFVLAGMIEPGGAGEEKKKGSCPLRRVQLWHVIPLCLLAILNLLLVIIALLGLAGYRIILGLQGVMVRLAKVDLDNDPYEEGLAGMDSGTVAVPESTVKAI